MDHRGLATIAGLIALVALGIVLVRLTGGPDEQARPATPPASPQTTATSAGRPPPQGGAGLALEDIATGLVAPWGVAFARGRTAYVSERDSGRILAMPVAGGRLREVTRLEVDAAGEGGLLGLAAHPDGVAEGGLYAYLTTARDNRIVRLRVGRAGRGQPRPEPVLTGIPAAPIHNGGRIAFGPDGMLYAGTGDAGVAERAQDRDSLGGKILRVTPGGRVPADNPFPGSPVFSLGHRNVQGLAWTGDGRLYAAEYGPDRDDEVNRVRPGRNYGWPLVTGRAGQQRFVDPVHVRQPPAASWSGAMIADSQPFPRWEGQLLAASLRGRRLWRLPLDGGQPANLLEGRLGRLRLVTHAPDGSLWLLTSNRDGRGEPRPGDDRIVRVTARR